MRLYLSSFRLGNHPGRLADLAGGGRVARVIANTCDYFPEAERRPRVERELRALEGLGFKAQELDLRRFFAPGGAQALRAELDGVGLVWARGGNSFLLRRAMRQSGFESLLPGALAADAWVYGGYSGGIAVLAPTLRGIEIVNDPYVAPPGYQAEVLWDGLGILPFSIAPHYKSPHPASPGIDEVVRYCEEHGLPYRTLKDGQVLIRHGEAWEMLE